MKITFLGTSSGAPTKQRNVTAIAIQHSAKRWCLVDCGEGTQHQILQTSLSLNNLEAIFITHVHGDHCYGLPGLLASAAMHGRTQPLVIVAPDEVRQFIEPIIELSQMRLSYTLAFINVITLGQRDLADFSVQAIPLSHRVPSYGYLFQRAEQSRERRLDIAKLQADAIPKGPLWGQIQRGEVVQLEGQTLATDQYLLPSAFIPAQKVIIGGDNDRPELLQSHCEGVNVVVHEATYTQAVADKVGAGPQHSSAAQVARFAEQAQVPHLILTHFSARYDRDSMHEIEEEARCFYQGALYLAQDFARYELTDQGELHEVN